MQYSLHNRPKAPFSNRKVSVEKAIKILKRNGIQSDEEQTKAILDFLYLIAKTAPKPAIQSVDLSEPSEEIELLIR